MTRLVLVIVGVVLGLIGSVLLAYAFWLGVTPEPAPATAGKGKPTVAGVYASPAMPRATPTRATRTRPTIGSRPRSNPPGTARAAALNWHALARCESTNNPRAVSSSGKYRGLYQFDLRTWRSVGGTGDPIDASPAEQTYRAQLLYAARGRSPWPSCGRLL